MLLFDQLHHSFSLPGDVQIKHDSQVTAKWHKYNEILEKVAINDALALEDAFDNDIISCFKFYINLLLPLIVRKAFVSFVYISLLTKCQKTFHLILRVESAPNCTKCGENPG